MTKQGGLGDALYVGGYNVSGDIQSVKRVGGGPAALDLTSIEQYAFERAGGKRDGAIEFTAFFNKSPGRAHEALSTMPTADSIVSYLRGTSLGAPAACLNGKQIGYDPTRAEDGALTIGTVAEGNSYGLEWGHNLTAGVAAQTAAGTLTGYADGVGAATAFGLQAYLHVFAFTGTSVVVSLEDSNNGGADPYTTVASFASMTGIGDQRIQTARNENIKQWLRVRTTGTFSLLWIAVIVVRNEVEVTF